MKYFVTSDNHFAHQAIIGYTQRPFRDVRHMDETMLRLWNERVKPEDTVFHLGDPAFRNSPGGNHEQGLPINPKQELFPKLNGHIVWIRGNHNNNNACKSIITNLTVQYGRLHISMCHDPANFVESTQYNPINLWLVGHVHRAWRHQWRGHSLEKLLINVSVDMWRFMPITLDEVLRYRALIIKTQNTYQLKDGHNKGLPQGDRTENEV